MLGDLVLRTDKVEILDVAVGTGMGWVMTATRKRVSLGVGVCIDKMTRMKPYALHHQYGVISAQIKRQLQQEERTSLPNAPKLLAKSPYH